MGSNEKQTLNHWHIVFAFALSLMAGILFHIFSLIIDQILISDIPDQIFSVAGSIISTLFAAFYLSKKYPFKYSVGQIKNSIGLIIKWSVSVGILVSIVQFPYSTIIGKKTISSHQFISIDSGVEYVALLLIMSILILPLVEEIFFRAYIYNMLKSRYSVKAAYVTTALIFAIMHPSNLLQSLLFFLSSLGLIYAYEKTGMIETSILAHMLWNASWFVSIYAYHLSSV